MPLDSYVTLGRSGLRVSPFCLGTMTFGQDWGWGAAVDESERILDRYMADGGNFVDTANVYTFGHSERIIGDHVGKVPSKRQRMVLATKFTSSMQAGDPNSGGAGRKALIASCEDSLRRLQTDYIDLYWLHSWDRFTPVEETMSALDALVRAGKVRYLGVSDAPAWCVAEAQMVALQHGWTPFIGLQVEYSLLERTVEGELIPMAQHFGLGVTPWSPLRSGILTGKYTREKAGQQQAGRGELVTTNLDAHAYDVIDELIRVASAIGSTPAHVALAWVQSRPGVTSTILGARTVKQLEANLAALDLVIPPEHLAALEAVSRPKLPFPIDFLKETASALQHAGATINGEAAPVPPLVRNERAPQYIPS
ncbi:MAG: aldo/keto reductase [Myxococcaceae bacterium]|nr:aldo/keto reductase [Myxococcaceae bacterium]